MEHVTLSIYYISYTKLLVHVTCLLVSVSELQPVRAVTVHLQSLHRRTLTKVNNLVQEGIEFNEVATLVIISMKQRPS